MTWIHIWNDWWANNAELTMISKSFFRISATWLCFGMSAGTEGVASMAGGKSSARGGMPLNLNNFCNSNVKGGIWRDLFVAVWTFWWFWLILLKWADFEVWGGEYDYSQISGTFDPQIWTQLGYSLYSHCDINTVLFGKMSLTCPLYNSLAGHEGCSWMYAVCLAFCDYNMRCHLHNSMVRWENCSYLRSFTCHIDVQISLWFLPPQAICLATNKQKLLRNELGPSFQNISLLID